MNITLEKQTLVNALYNFYCDEHGIVSGFYDTLRSENPERFPLLYSTLYMSELVGEDDLDGLDGENPEVDVQVYVDILHHSLVYEIGWIDRKEYVEEYSCSDELADDINCLGFSGILYKATDVYKYYKGE